MDNNTYIKNTYQPTQTIFDNNVKYTKSNKTHENYWFQDIFGTLFNLDYLNKILPTNNMKYPEKINAVVRLSIYIGVILALLNSNFLYIYIPIITMLITYFLYIFRIEELENARALQGANTKLSNMKQETLNNIVSQNMIGNHNESFTDILNISHCAKPMINNPFMNRLLFDSKTRDIACDVINPETRIDIDKEYNKYCIKDVSDIWNHNSGRRQFYTMPNTNLINNQSAFANWLYKMPSTCKEGNGSQCIANLPNRLNSNLITPGFSQ